MLDVFPLVKAILLGALVAAAVMRLAIWGAPRPWRRNACWTWAIAAGVFAASGATGQWPHWPPLEDRARFLTIVAPLCIVVESLAAMIQSRGKAWIARVGLAALVAPVLLHNTVYLADLNGPGSAEWSLGQATIVLCGLALSLSLVWASLSALQTRTSTRTVMWMLILDALATAVTVMLSGYYRAGLLGLGLSGAIAGATLASYITQPQLSTLGSLGMGVIGVFTVAMIGRFFGALSTTLAVSLLLAPLLAWTFELPRLRELSSRWRAAGRIACVLLPLIVIVTIAQRNFTAASAARSGASGLNAVGDLE